MLVDGRELLRAAQAGGYAVGSFNTYNLEGSQAIFRAAEALGAPVFVAVGAGALRHADPALLVPMLQARAQASTVPVALHLDHARQLAEVEEALRRGLTSVMVDGSALPLEENIALTRRVVEAAHGAGVAVEGELGGIPGQEDRLGPGGADAALTDPAAAARFVEATGVDALAVSVGNVHGFYRGEPRLDLPRLEAIRRAVDVPLVLHGASGLPEAAIRAAIARGVCKFNVNTELRAAFLQAVAAHLEEALAAVDLVALLAPAVQAMQEVVEEKIRLFRGPLPEP
ncbi:MAG: class II fructose-bisphosphate aldolase [Anaerolineae bacterium]|nr:class II fructose-bisphosphate aldolase [Anaerolineae bacterium]